MPNRLLPAGKLPLPLLEKLLTRFAPSDPRLIVGPRTGEDAAVFDFGDRYLAEASDYAADVIECTRDICTYIYETHGRFPAHCETIHVPGIWIQIHHVEEAYYERFFKGGLTATHKSHQHDWH
jgi:hypothetical protein